MDAVCLYGIVHFNFHERSELTSILTSIFTSETSVNVIKWLNAPPPLAERKGRERGLEDVRNAARSSECCKHRSQDVDHSLNDELPDSLLPVLTRLRRHTRRQRCNLRNKILHCQLFNCEIVKS